MSILIITGNLAYPLVCDVLKDLKEDIIVHAVDNIEVAAFLTPNQIIKAVKSNFNLNDIDLIIVPGLIKKTTVEVTKVLGIPTFKGSTDCADLAMVISSVDDIELSEIKPANQLIEEKKRVEALNFINNFEKNNLDLLDNEKNILIKNLPVGEDFPMRVLAEIANAPFLSKDELIKKAQYFVDSGADMIDIGMAAGEDFSDKIPDLINTLRPVVGDRPLSIDTLNVNEIKVACENGIDFVLSLDLGNVEKLIAILNETNIPAVLLPTNFSKAVTPKTIDDRINYMNELINKVGNLNYVADMILDPINSLSIVDSIIACDRFHKMNKAPLFFGVGNVTELLDTDSTGVNVLLAGIASEIGASILFTPEESGKTKGSVFELAIASKMMFLAKHRQSIPKDLGISLIRYKDKKRSVTKVNKNVPVIKQDVPIKFVRDKAGSFKINVLENEIIASHFKKNKKDLIISGASAREVYEEIIKQGLVTRLEHAAYLGSELQKAEIAMKLGKNYTQDFNLFNEVF